ncbi:hypothetical protein EOL73_00115 [Candidatus Saccharibacteria bacterium]|nr:hypothetical protein [Candidatus Saccharibacteria bacterium]
MGEPCQNEARIITLEQMQNAQNCKIVTGEKAYDALFKSNGNPSFSERVREVEKKIKLMEDVSEIVIWARNRMDAEKLASRHKDSLLWTIIERSILFFVLGFLAYIAHELGLKI